MAGCIFFYIKINRTIYFISIALGYDILYHHNLFYDMSGCGRLNAGFYTIELLHSPMKKVGVFLYHFHWLEFFELCFFAYFIFGFSSFFFKMTCIGNIAHISNFIFFMKQVSVYYIKCDIRPGMSQMAFATYSWSTHIHTYMPGSNRFKNFFYSRV